MSGEYYKFDYKSTVLMLSLSDYLKILKIHGPIYAIHELWDVE